MHIVIAQGVDCPMSLTVCYCAFKLCFIESVGLVTKLCRLLQSFKRWQVSLYGRAMCRLCCLVQSLVGLFTTLCVDSAVYYRVWWVVYHAMCRLCCLLQSQVGCLPRYVQTLFTQSLTGWLRCFFLKNSSVGNFYPEYKPRPQSKLSLIC